MTEKSVWQRQADGWRAWASDYDARIAGMERRFLGPTRPWVCSRAMGRTLEVAGGTGANLAHYPAGVELTFTELSPEMLALATAKPHHLTHAPEFALADAMALPYPDDTFDSVVCTYALCGVPDERIALAEMLRVLRPGGNLLLADHVEASAWWVRLLQRGLEAITSRTNGEFWTRRPKLRLEAVGVEIVETLRTTFGVLECVHAVKPTD